MTQAASFTEPAATFSLPATKERAGAAASAFGLRRSATKTTSEALAMMAVRSRAVIVGGPCCVCVATYMAPHHTLWHTKSHMPGMHRLRERSHSGLQPSYF